jgi:succinate-semialdehyde dehydrogenase/glutarate-semialdehyde dehydrogenase
MAAALEAARKAQAAWAAMPYRERARRLRLAGTFMSGHIDAIIGAIHRDNGKLPLDALAAELLPAFMSLDYYIRHGKRFMRPQALGGGNLLMFNKRSALVYRPYGVVGIISPWNYPFAIPFSEVVMALLAGNAVILKVASVTPGVGAALAAIFAAAELPAGLFTWAGIPGKEAGPAFIASGMDKLFFTGSTATGRELMALAAPRLLPLVLELGGADAAIICEDADLDRAALGILWSGYSNAGQSCGGAQRILVHQAVYEPFLEKLCALVKALRPGADLGPMTTVNQKRSVEKAVEASLAAGAVVAARSPDYIPEPGDPFADRYLSALVLTLPPGAPAGTAAPVITDEVFGPVTVVIPVKDDEEALRKANESSYGLTGSVWSRNRRRARLLAARVNAGAVMINDHLMSHGLAETPWGGFGDSGLGRTHGSLGFREMLKAQVVVDDILPGAKRELWWQPYSAKVYQGIRAITEFLGGPSLASRIGAIPGVLRIVGRYWSKK